MSLGGVPLAKSVLYDQRNHSLSSSLHFFSSGTFMPSRSLILKEEICAHKIHWDLYGKNISAKMEQLKSTLLWSAKLGRKQWISRLRAEEALSWVPFLSSPAGGKFGPSFALIIPPSVHWPLRSLWKVCPWEKTVRLGSLPPPPPPRIWRQSSGPWPESHLTAREQAERLSSQLAKCRLNTWFPSLNQCTFLK